MARGKKEQKIDTLRHRSGLTVDIFFNPNTDGEYALSFTAKIGDQRFRNANAAQLKQEVYAYIEANLVMTWHPVIVVSEVAPFSPGRASFVGIEVHRVYLTNGADGRIRQLDWDDYDVADDAFGRRPDESIHSYRLSHSQQHWMGLGKVPDDLPYKTKSSDKETRILPYSEELYTGLVEIDAGIDRLKARLRTLLTNEQGWTKIASIGAQLCKLLPAPEEVANES